jgi:hypothetical protein
MFGWKPEVVEASPVALSPAATEHPHRHAGKVSGDDPCPQGPNVSGWRCPSDHCASGTLIGIVTWMLSAG